MNRVNKVHNIKKLLVLSFFILQVIHSDNLTQQDQWGNTPLMLAIQKLDQSTALSLINQMNGSDFNIQDHWGNTALMWAIQKLTPTSISQSVNSRNRRKKHRHHKLDFESMDMSDDYIKYIAPQPLLYATTIALPIMNKMDQAGLSLQDHWKNTALIWAVEQNMPDIGIALIPKMSIASLQLQDVHNETALQKMQSKSNFSQAINVLRKALNLAPLESTASGQLEPTPLDSVERAFGDYLNPFAIPPAQVEVKSTTLTTKDFSHKNLAGADLSNHDWSNYNFSGANLNNANFTNSTVDNAIFTGASLQGTNFESCNITAAQLLSAATCIEAWFSGNNQFQHANFTGKALNGCCFENCNLTGTVFDQALLQGTDFTNANLTLCSFKESHIDSLTLFESAIIDRANFTQSSLKSNHIKQLLSYKNGNFSQCDFSQQTLTGIDFSNCDLTNTNITNADCSFCNFSRAQVSAKQLSTTKDLSQSNLSYLILDGLEYQNKSLSKAIIRNSSLQNCNLTGATLDYASISNSDFSNSICHQISMQEPELLNSKFINTDFSNATQMSRVDFTSCNLKGAIFDYSNPIYSQFSDTTLSDAQLSQAFGPSLSTTMYSTTATTVTSNNPTLTLTTTKGHLILWPVQTKDALQNLRITSVEWQEVAKTSRLEIPGVTFYTLSLLDQKAGGKVSAAGPHGIALSVDKAYPEKTFSMIARFGTVNSNAFSQWGQINFNLLFTEPFPMTTSSFKEYTHKNFSHQWIESRSFDNCNFSHSNFSNGYFKGCSFSGANMSFVNFKLANLQDCNFTNAVCSYSVMQSFLAGANFTNTVVDHASFALSTGFTGQQLMQTQKEHPFISIQGLPSFDHCDLSERNFSHAVMNSMNFLLTSFKNSNLSHADLSNSNCDGANFNNANLEGALCSKGIFTHTDFQNANLNQTDFSGADLRQAIFSSPDQIKTIITDKNTRFDKVLIIK